MDNIFTPKFLMYQFKKKIRKVEELNKEKKNY